MTRMMCRTPGDVSLARKDIGDHDRVSTGIRAEADLKYHGTAYAKRGDTLRIWQMKMDRDGKDDYIFPVVEKPTCKYPNLFLEPRTEAQADARTMLNPYANDPLIASMDILEPPTAPCVAFHKRKTLSRCLVEGEFGRTKSTSPLHNARELGWKEKVDQVAMRVLE
ncbi:unnamed protein product [Zymoseptoria tritici ST99CH_3D7]|uniref:Uncharacterized protein n=1 Tax=Zymoseptoria tritici (strain ST99CH_3D7) TaxID=1276538 RepID=A0A1X7S8L0_ZYMT9|nr:unnamed protein product [Zymoseptoria tritici ST99CH_3D7]